MIKSLCICFKFSIRFLFILFFTVALLIGGYTCIFHKENGYIDDILIQLVKSTNKEENIKIGKIEESWSWDGLYLKIDKLNYKTEDLDLKIYNTKIKIDLLNTIKDKTLKIESLDINSLEFNYNEKELKNKKESTQNLNLKSIIEYINKKEINLDSIALNINKASIKIPNQNIDIDNIKFNKDNYSDLFYIHYKDKVSTSFNYKIKSDKNIISLYVNVDSNRFYLKKLISLFGKEEWLDFIYFDDIYTVIGDLKSEVVLNYDYVNKKILNDYNARIILNGNTIKLKSYETITLTNAIGNLYYNDKKGFFSDEITSNLNRKKTTLLIEQEDQLKDITFKFKTKVDLNKLSEIANFPLDKILNGSGVFSGFYKLNFDEEDHLFVESSFDDFNYNTLLNLKKSSGFYLNGYFDYDNGKMNFNIQQGTNKVLLNFINDNFYNALIGVNKEPIMKKDSGLFINGFLENEKLLDLIDSMKDINSKFSNEESTNSNELTNVFFEMDLKNTEFVDQNFDNINVLFQNETLALTFDEADADGYLYFNENTKTIDINLNKLKIKESEATNLIKKNLKSHEGDIKSFDYSKILNEDYKISINIGLLSFYDYPEMSLITNGDLGNGKLTLNEFKLYEIDDSFKLSGQYKYDSKTNTSEIIKIDKIPLITINDFNKIQKNSGFTTDKIILDGFLNWKGFNFKEIGKTLNGKIDISINKGHIDKNNASVGFLKLLNLFNFDSWLKMFSFNFEEIDEGLYFNSIKGTFNIKDNIVNINPRIILDSDLFILEFSGQVDYVKSVYDVKIDAIVPLLNKAPAIALFAGVAPEIVGIIWLVDKLAGDIISDTFTRSSFNVSGDFENPIYTKNEI